MLRLSTFEFVLNIIYFKVVDSNGCGKGEERFPAYKKRFTFSFVHPLSINMPFG